MPPKKKARKFTWSLSALKDYERCPRLFSWRRIERKTEPPSPPMIRGEKMHLFMEKAVTDCTPLPKTLAKFEPRVAELREQKNIEVEQMWAIDRDWNPVDASDYEKIWGRAKLDYFARPSKTIAHVLDWKSGQIYGDHAEGMGLYAAFAFKRYPEIKQVRVSLEYLDAKRGYDHIVKRAELPGIIEDFNNRVVPIERDKVFKPRPGKHCSWCSFNPSKGGDCDAAQA